MDWFEILPRPAVLEGEVRWLLFRHGHLLVQAEGGALPAFRPPGLPEVEEHYLGRFHDCHCLALELPEQGTPPDGLVPADMRQMLRVLDEREFVMASRASQVLAWRRNHRFCSRCGAPAVPHACDRAMVCPDCGYTQYPRITPCVIMLVSRGREALLARSTRFRTPMFSCLAGFMEAGESAEQAVAREVFEETGLRVHNLRYHGSQSWPFPHSLMLGFRAEWRSGEIHIDQEEIAEAGWFVPENLPPVPPRGSIARTLIDDWVAQSASERGSHS